MAVYREKRRPNWLPLVIGGVVVVVVLGGIAFALAGNRTAGETPRARVQAATAEETVQKVAARLGATELSEKTRAYILEELRRSPAPPDLVPARAVGLLLGAPELQRR